MNFQLSIGRALLWMFAYFFIMLFYTFLEIAVWRKYFPGYAEGLSTITVALCSLLFLFALRRTGYSQQFFAHVHLEGLLLAAACVFFFYFALDLGLDPVLERAFPQSESAYEEALYRLAKAPVAGFLRVCVVAPVVEESLMRGFVLGGLAPAYGVLPALLISSVLFALLHFNMVQTLSALLCGVMLGILYLHTGSLFCCILAHMGYNALSYIKVFQISMKN